MGRHKLAGNGIVFTTSLPEADLRSICDAVAAGTRGDLWNGSYRITQTTAGDGWVVYDMRTMIKLSHMQFAIYFRPAAAGRIRVHTEIRDYFASQWKLYYLIPLGPKKMVAHHSYLQFMQKLANTIQQSDPSARIDIAAGPHIEVSPDTRQPLGAVVEVAPAVAPAASPAAAPISSLPVATVNPVSVQVVPVAVEASTAVTTIEEVPLDRTVAAPPRRSATIWTLAPEGLEPIQLETEVVAGRAPGSDPRSITVPDGEHTVSKLHARFELGSQGPVVTDLGSTNGTTLSGPDGEEIECPPGIATPIPAGWWVELGSYPVRLESTRRDRR